ncbi:family 20 glycosylhydrolase [Arthrobacter sp. ISL-30]|uniref:family 20 glycosylhydrolase n=1 Tax=Arthrobacter sp. ISL-30 TaxID=2819109 RepID=UPI001BE83F8C|nr:family 20 glycosylhydrolase [Arthrobacter sp. ISL-30]MBT2514512.1 family 20 glycosylhydrolase [Arthrobacter sp. ISL-30]
MHPAELVIPRPLAVTVVPEEVFELGPGATIIAHPEAHGPAGLLALLLRRPTGFPLPIAFEEQHEDQQQGNVTLELKESTGSGPEHYTLAVRRQGVLISAPTPAGLYNGIQTLRQLFPADIESVPATPRSQVAQSNGTHPAQGSHWKIPGVDIVDGPRFQYRGIMLDVARSFFPVEDVKWQIDTMSQFKLNALHLHLTDDQAWRIELDNPTPNPSGIDYRNLSRVGGAGAVDHPEAGLPPGLPGFYTKADLRELSDYAAARNVLLVPEIDVPGHVNAALAAVPQLNTDGAAKATNSTGAVGYSTLEAHNPATYEFVREVLAQLAEITPGPYLHIGGDEAEVTLHSDYLKMVAEFSRMVAGLGKTVIGWNEYADAELPNGAVIQYWHGSLGAVRRQAQSGAQVIMSPAAHTYLDQKYDSASPIGLEWVEGGPFTWAEYYGWDPAAFGIMEEHILGVEALLWTETVRGNDQAAWLMYPRAISVAEVGWTAQAARHVEDFRRRLGAFAGRLTRQGVTFQPAPDVEWAVPLPPGYPKLFRRADPAYGRIEP